MKATPGQASLNLNLLGGVTSDSPSLQLVTGTPVQVALYPLAEEDFCLRHPDHQEVIRFSASGWKPLLRRRASPAEFEHFARSVNLPPWTIPIFVSLYEFYRSHRWQPSEGLLIDLQTDLPDGFGLGIEQSWGEAIKRALARRKGLTQQPRSSSLSKNGARSLIRANSPITTKKEVFFALPSDLSLVAWLGDRPNKIEPEFSERICTSLLIGKHLLENQLRKNLPSISAMTPSLFHRYAPSILPEKMSGAQVLLRFPELAGKLPSWDKRTDYPVRDSVGYLLRENQRTSVAAHLMKGLSQKMDPAATTLLGQLLIQAHEEQHSLGLGCREADQMLDTLMDLGSRRGIHGARLATVGPEGFSLIVLLERRAWPALKKLRNCLYFSSQGPWPLLL